MSAHASRYNLARSTQLRQLLVSCSLQDARGKLYSLNDAICTEFL
jgi:hypothetical protein